VQLYFALSPASAGCGFVQMRERQRATAVMTFVSADSVAVKRLPSLGPSVGVVVEAGRIPNSLPAESITAGRASVSGTIVTPDDFLTTSTFEPSQFLNFFLPTSFSICAGSSDRAARRSRRRCCLR
jgi:hypothetical protein